MEYIRKSSKTIKHLYLKDFHLCRRTGRIFSYDYIKYSEPSLKLSAKDEESFKDVDLMLLTNNMFDNYRQK